MKTSMGLMCLFFAIILFANDKNGEIKGRVGDASGHGLSYVSIEVYTIGDVQDLVSGGMTDESGNFLIKDVPFGDYEVVFSAVGFTDKILNVKVEASQVNLGTVTLGNEEIVALDGAEIRAETSQYRTEIDKRVVDVGKDLISAGADAATLLNNIPSISVDQQTGELSLRGNENVKVMVDGKPTNIPVAQLLKQLPSNSIAKIEIITNPSAKYEPEGNSGIINIITHKNKRKGYNVGIDMGFTQGRKSRHNASLNANLNTGSFNFFGNYSGFYGKNRFLGEMRNYDTDLNQEFDILNDNQTHNIKVGFDWFIGEKTGLTLSTTQFFNSGKGVANTGVLDVANDQFYQNINDFDGYYTNRDYNMNFKQDFGKEDHNIILDATYSTSENPDYRYYENNFPEGIFEENREAENNLTRINFDYTNQIIEGGKIESGLQFRQQTNENSLYSTQLLVSDNGEEYNPFAFYDFTRNIYSAYLNYGQTFGKFGMQLGLRAEHVTEETNFNIALAGQDVLETEYTEFYPSAFFTYELSEKGQMSLNYSRRVDRPDVSQMTPVPDWNTSTVTSTGNPNLLPQFTNSVELGYLQKFKSGSISGTVIYRSVSDMIFRYIEVDANDSNKLIQYWANYNDTNSYGFEISGNYKPLKWWNFNTSFDLFSNKMVQGENEINAVNWNYRINNTVTLSKNLSLQHFFMYRGPFEFIQGKMKPMWRMDLGVRYSFMDQKATLTARVSDVFRTFYGRADITSPNESYGEFKWEAQTLYIGVSYNFGGNVRKREVQQENQQGVPSGDIGF